jgi:hypothetical protein
VSAEDIPATPAEAWQRYSFARDPIGWHYQPVCVCGDYICQHEKPLPHRCGFSSRPSQCRCFGYRFARMGTGPHPDDRRRWEAAVISSAPRGAAREDEGP